MQTQRDDLNKSRVIEIFAKSFYCMLMLVGAFETRKKYQDCDILSLHAHALVRYCHFGVSPVNYSDSDSDVI